MIIWYSDSIVSTLHFNLNRPIHLARRDVFFERAVELLNMPLQDLDTASRIQQTETILFLLRIAELHAFFAARSTSASSQEHDFLRFIKLLVDNVQSIHAMMQHQSHLEEDKSFLCQFLAATPEQCALPAMHYQRRSEDLFEGLWHILQIAHTPYRHLQQTTFDHMTEEERGRYRKAYDSFREEILSRYAVAPKNGIPTPSLQF